MIELYKSGMTFSEKPVSKEEREIAQLFKSLWQARTKKDPPGTTACYLEEAKIKTRHHPKYLTMKEYEIHLKNSLPNHYVSRYDNLVIRVQNKNSAEVQTLSYFRYTNKSWGPAYQYYRLKKIETGWKIEESRWLDN